MKPHLLRRLWPASAGLLLLWLSPARPACAAAIDLDSELPAFSLTDLDGHTYGLPELRDRVVILYFLGYSCDVCADIARQLEDDFSSKYGYENLRIFAIDSWDGSAEELAALRDRAGVSFPFLMNGSAFLSACDLPWHSFLIVDGEGVVRYVSPGPDVSAYDPVAMDRVVQEYLPGTAGVKVKTWGAIKGLYSGKKLSMTTGTGSLDP